MKLIRSLTAIIALSFIVAPLARAQETETPTEKTSATPAEATEPAASATPTPPAVEKSPADRTEKPKATPSPKSSPAVNAAQKPAKGSVESQLKEIENTYEAAVPSHNVAAIEPFIADDCVVTNTKGKVMNRRAWLADFRKDTDTYTSARNMKMNVHMAAQNIAVVTGSSREIGKDKAGKPFDRTFLWTDTFVDRNGKWMIVASHASLTGNK